MRVHLFHFSPRGTTFRAASAIAEGLGPDPRSWDLAVPDFAPVELAAGDVAVLAAPVYSGRIPPAAARSLRRVAAHGNPAVAVAVYGNRAFDDALAELQDIAWGCGFQVVAGCAAIGEHALLHALAAGRPAPQDLSELAAFGRDVARKLARGDLGEPDLPGSRPYKAVKPSPIGAVCDASKCYRCGMCAVRCPIGAVNPRDPTQTDALTCIQCGRCIDACPAKARAFPKALSEGVAQRLSPLIGTPRKNAFFL